ncbi:MAG: radical SAM protein [Candidatus Aminicenantes bacterium]|nr:radical SAM protein [Candidatus Aminicenantes bacterium]
MNKSHVYGPVPSRRLGLSLGVDILPFKVCTLDCVYCQLGPTNQKTTEIKDYFSEEKILSQIKKRIETAQHIDFITFSGSGEPTLNSRLGPLIEKIKTFTDIPVAVLTNSTLLTQKKVRDSLKQADLVVPSLDAATQEVFETINRPHPLIRIHDVIEGLKKFRKEFHGQIWLEIILVKGVNDSDSHIKALKKVIQEIKPDKVQLNTVIRPPSEKSALALNQKEMERIKRHLGNNCEIVADFKKRGLTSEEENLKDLIFDMICRRPVTAEDISNSLGRHRNEVIKYIDLLKKEDKIKSVPYENKDYYEPK